MTVAKDELDEDWIASMVDDVAAVCSTVLETSHGVFTAPSARLSAFIGVEHLASVAAKRLAERFGGTYEECFHVIPAKHKGHWPGAQKDPPRVRVALNPLCWLTISPRAG